MYASMLFFLPLVIKFTGIIHSYFAAAAVMFSRPFTLSPGGRDEIAIRGVVALEERLQKERVTSLQHLKYFKHNNSSKPASTAVEPILCQLAPFFTRPKRQDNGKRDKLETSISYSVDKDCHCGKKCLQQLKQQGNFF